MTNWTQRILVGAALLPTVAGAQAVGASSTEPQAATAALPTASAASAASKATDAPQDPQQVVVTAQRYKQFLQDVPLSVSVVSADELKARNVTTLDEMQYSVPGLTMFQYGIGEQFIELRGVSNTTGAPTIGTYLDETPLALERQGNAVNIRLLDMQRVEVLRGPQATLYGEGSMGGTIRYIPADPKLTGFSGSAEGKFTSTEDGGKGYETTAVVNLPLIENTLGLRVVADHERVGGYIDSVATGRKDVNAGDVNMFRANLLAEPTDRLSLSLLALYQKSSQDYKDFGVNRETNAAVPTYDNDQYTLLQGKVDYDLDFATLTASVSHIDRKSGDQSDITPFYLPYTALLGAPAGSITQIGQPETTDYGVYNAEAHLSSEGKSAFGWTLGGSYRTLNDDVETIADTAPGTLPITLLAATEHVHSKTFTGYGEGSYAFSAKLKATAGLRYYNERLSQDTDSTVLGASAVDVNKGTFTTVNPRFNLSYEFSRNSMVYTNIAKGFRAGGFNLTSAGGPDAFLVPPTYKPDRIWTYEVGGKQQLFDNRVFLDASVYRSEWSGVQSYDLAPGSPITIVDNSGHVSGWGTDISLSARPVAGLTLSGTYSWNNLAFDKTTADKLPGDPVDGAVRKSYSASLEYRHLLTDTVTGFFRVDYQHAGPARITVRNFNDEIVKMPGRNLANVRVGTDVGKVELALFASNLFDVRTPIIVGPFGVNAENVEQRPRTIGGSAKVDF